MRGSQPPPLARMVGSAGIQTLETLNRFKKKGDNDDISWSHMVHAARSESSESHMIRVVNFKSSKTVHLERDTDAVKKELKEKDIALAAFLIFKNWRPKF